MSITIKQVDDETAVAVVVSLAQRIWREHYTSLIGVGQVEYMLERFQSFSAITEQIRTRYAYYLLINSAGTEAGYFAVVPKAGGLFLSKLYVSAQCRGQGYGRAAVHYAVALARQKGLSLVTLTVNRNNRDTISAYQKFGFVITGDVRQDIGNGYEMDDHVMALAVEAAVRPVS